MGGYIFLSPSTRLELSSFLETHLDGPGVGLCQIIVEEKIQPKSTNARLQLGVIN